MALNKEKTVFFCGIGGSGMMPLALIMLKKGFRVAGSDRGYDQGLSPEKFNNLTQMGVCLHPQDGSGLNNDVGVLVVSSAIEPSIPDVKISIEKGISIRKRADVLSEVFHLSNCSIGVSGTSGKSTVTGMIATILQECDFNPSMMNGGRVANLEDDGHTPVGNYLVGGGDSFVSEMDESDGTIDLFSPDIAVINNIALDHTSLDILENHFNQFIARSQKAVVANADNKRVMSLDLPENCMRFSLNEQNAQYFGYDLNPTPRGISFHIKGKIVRLSVPGEHNVYNALAALCVADNMGIAVDSAIAGLEKFTGIHRRLQFLGCTQNNVTIIDDFAHNPDKLAASLQTLKNFEGRLVILFQPHGFAPLQLMGKEMAQVFGRFLGKDDVLCIPEVYYAGGTVDRSVTSKDFVEMIKHEGVRHASWFETRLSIKPYIDDILRSGDRLVVMGARDDTLTDFAKSFL